VSELIIRKLHDGQPLTPDEGLWVADVLGRVRAAVTVQAGLPAEHPESDRSTRHAFLAGVLDHVLSAPEPPGDVEDVARSCGYLGKDDAR
jgi:hypothetical protein